MYQKNFSHITNIITRKQMRSFTHTDMVDYIKNLERQP